MNHLTQILQREKERTDNTTGRNVNAISETGNFSYGRKTKFFIKIDGKTKYWLFATVLLQALCAIERGWPD